ncbi:MAG: DUF1488 family protein [Burkholderiales bacterium]
MTPTPFFHQESEAVRFWVEMDNGEYIGATISKQTLHYRFQAEMSGANALAVYNVHREEIDAAVLRRVKAGSREPVMLREADVAKR